ncbi:ATP-dependent DNA helicase UvrD2 [Candidatus Woesearchaeota archaeon]|nr:ATP-dependent DNA helicase UvrD2 [Candidatus Woesearchaeota archaeon]
MDEKDYLLVLRALKEVPFNVGKNLLIDILIGDINNPSVERNKLHELNCFGDLAYSKEELSMVVDSLIRHGFIEQISFSTINKYAKVLKISVKGVDELRKPTFFKRKLAFSNNQKTFISSSEKELFKNFDFFLKDLNDEQKKAVVTPSKNVVCVAGAGSGKTRVLTKRVEFLIKYRGVNPSRILAITFTRKARQEMMYRLESSGITNARVETFNSFCEKVLRLHNDLIYDKPVRVMSFKDKIVGIRRALQEQGLNLRDALSIYFSYAQRRGKTDDQLAAIFMNDCFLALDTFKARGGLVDFSKDAPSSSLRSAQLLYNTCKELEEYMAERGLRDFSDQLLDALSFFRNNSSLVPEFDHILIDEFQDVNSSQMDLVELLNSENLFCVGDPRQSIFGWRGSDIKFIMEFEQSHDDVEVIFLRKNYRSQKLLVQFMNLAIKKLNMPDLESVLEEEGFLKLLKFKSEEEEHLFVLQAILGSEIPREEIFVLARTNKTLNEFSRLLKNNNVSHVVKSDEQIKKVDAKKGEVTLATVHAIKGLESELVFVLGCNSMNFPCKTSEHPVAELIKIKDYDKEEEERRLFYVAVSRAKKKLVMTYSGKNPSYFISSEMRLLAEKGKSAKFMFSDKGKKDVLSESFVDSRLNNKAKLLLLEELKVWRKNKSISLGIPAFTIFHDSTLLELIEKAPLDVDELGLVKGIGSEKIKKFGDELLSLIAKYS